ncbi:MAG: hypothetical protein M1388_00985 [Thaumarchaeota archaeon]|nr:hypothetical protein [Nitrososphaerota archaeon]
MPRPGYNVITVRTSLYEELKKDAKAQDLSVPAYLKLLVEMNRFMRDRQVTKEEVMA